MTELNKVSSDLNKKIGETDLEIKKAQKDLKQAKSIINNWIKDYGPITDDYDFLSNININLNSLQEKKIKLDNDRDDKKDEISRFSSQIDSQSKILALLDTIGKDVKEIPCPVCKRPLSEEMIREISDGTNKIKSELEKKISEKQNQITKINNEIKENNLLIGKLNDYKVKISSFLEQEPHRISILDMEGSINKLRETSLSLKKDIKSNEDQTSDLTSNISDVERDITEIQLKVDDSVRRDKMKSLIIGSKGLTISKLIIETLQSSLDNQRSVFLEPLTREISELWSSFLGKDVIVSLTDQAQLEINDQHLRSTITFPQLSGGEKTALLIFTQMLLCKYFSDADFMMLDEPLEHLDAMNRFALVKYLIDTTKRSIPQQIIITTVEESILREYFDDPEIKVSILSKEYPLLEGLERQ